MNVWKHLGTVLLRELTIWVHRPLYLIGSLFTMVFCCVFYLTFLGAGVPTDIPIGIVDNDHSSLSRNFTAQLDATQTGKVLHFEDFSQARDAMQKGEICGFCVIPNGMYANVQRQRQPKLTFYTNNLYFLGGSLAYKTFMTMANLTSGAVQRQVLRMKGVNETAMMGRLRPVDVDTHQIGNATMNYGAYLANMILPGMLEMIVIILTIYAFGTELKYSTSRHLLRLAGDSAYIAFIGKAIYYLAYFTMLGILLMVLLYHWVGFPLSGSIWSMFLDVFLLVASSEAIGLFIIGLFPVTRFALSIGGLFSVLAISLTGFTLPIEAALPAIQGFAAIVPLRHYYMFYVQEAMFATGFAGWYMEVIHMLIFLVLPLTVFNRLKHAYVYQDYDKN